MLRRLMPLLAVLLALGAAAPARALTTISTNVTLPGDPTYGDTINDNVEVTGSAVLTINPGGSITGFVDAKNTSTVTVTGGTISKSLFAEDSSTVTISGGTIGEDLQANDTSTVTISGGTISGNLFSVDSSVVTISGTAMIGDAIKDVVANDSSTINVTGGTISGDLFAGHPLTATVDTPTVNVSGGTISGDLEAEDNSVVTISGTATIGDASADTVTANDSSTINVTGGTISGSLLAGDSSTPTEDSPTVTVSGGSIGVALRAFDRSAVTVSGGSIGDDLAAAGSSTVNVSGGSIADDLTAAGSSTVNVSGGSIGDILLAGEFSTINLTGGSIAGSLGATSSARLHIFGCNLTLTATHISGTLLDGSALNNGVFNASGIVLHDDLEPPTLTCPTNVTVAATSASGAVVTYAVGASDNRPGVSVSCSPPSGSTFPVGDTTVNCTATDACGNQSFCSFTVTVLPSADLAISQTASLSTVKSGSNLTYTLLVTNVGPHAASGVVVNDPVPSGAVFVSAPGASVTPSVGGSGTVSWNVGALSSGQSVALTLTVKVKQKGNSTISNTATVSSSPGSPDPNPANNAATLQTKVIGNSK